MSEADNARLVIVLEAQSKKMQNQLVQVTKQIDRFAAQTTQRFDAMNAKNAASFAKLGDQVHGSLDGISRSVAALGVGISVKGVLDYANAWQEAQNKIAAAEVIGGIQARSLDDIASSAMRTRTDLSDYVDVYARMMRVAPGVAASELQVARAADIVSEAFKAGGASAQEQRNGIIQLGQALGSGFLQGQDLRALREDAPVLAQAIANYFHTTIGGLKKLGAEGKIASSDTFKAILVGGDAIDRAFAATTATINDAVTNIRTAFMRYVGEEGATTGATKMLVDALQYLATNFKTIAPIVVDFLTILAGAFGAKMFVVFAGAVGEATVALGGFLAAMATGEVTLAGVSAAMGPLALLVGAVAAAWWLLKRNQEEAAAAAEAFNTAINANTSKLDLAKTASVEYRAELRKQIQVQLAAAEAALEEAGAQYKASQARKAYYDSLPPATRNLYEGLDSLTGNAMGTHASSDPTGAIAGINTAMSNVKKLQGQLGQLVDIDKTPPGTSDHAKGSNSDDPTLGGKTKSDPYQSAVESIKKRTDALTAETAAQAGLNPLVNDYGFALDKAKASSDLLSAAQKAGIAITPELLVTIDKLATGYADADVAAKKLAESQDQLRADAELLRDTLKDTTSGFIQDLLDGKSAAEALGDALSNVGNKLISLGLDTLFGGGSNKGNGILGDAINQVLHLNAKGGIASHGRPMPVFASGGVSNQASIFGEAGPEAAVPLPDGRRIPVDLRMPAPSNDNGAIHVTLAPVIDAHGADSAAVARLQQVVAQMKTDLPATVIGAVRTAKKQRKL